MITKKYSVYLVYEWFSHEKTNNFQEKKDYCKSHQMLSYNARRSNSNAYYVLKCSIYFDLNDLGIISHIFPFSIYFDSCKMILGT